MFLCCVNGNRLSFLFIHSYVYVNHFQSSIVAGAYEYHLRVYVYQARNLLALDKDSFSG